MTTPYRLAQEDIMRHWLHAGMPTPVVDLGGGGHRAWMRGFVGEDFETWDARARRDVTRVVDACDMMGVADGSLGTILCVSVIEHIREPWMAAREIARVMRVRGTLFVAAPFRFPFHEAPGDYWRFTPDGLRVLFSETFGEMGCGWFGDNAGAYFVGRRRS